MRKKANYIPVNKMADNFKMGISIEKLSINELRMFGTGSVNAEQEAKQWHREDCHSFFLLVAGTVHMEMDFEKYRIKASSVTYIHPDQVHRVMSLKDVTVISLGITNENLNPAYLKLLEEITPVKPLPLNKATFAIISDAVTLCIKLADRKTDKLYHSMLKDSCNAMVALIISQYLEQAKSTGIASRFEVVTKAFRQMLERNYATLKRPADYARLLNISTPYLNECVKHTTGYPVSLHIQQRIILEAKRALYHSNHSVKEIATSLGYDDYAYFSRLFTKVAGTTALEFRRKNLG